MKRTIITVSFAALCSCTALTPPPAGEDIAYRASRYPTLQERALQAPAETPDQARGLTPTGVEVRVMGEPSGATESRIYRGKSFAQKTSGDVTGAGALVLNFDNASIAEAAALIFGEFLGKAYEVHPEVSGTINLRSADALQGRDVIRAFETVLRQNDAALVFDSGLYRVVPEADAIGYAAAPQIGSGQPVQPGFAVQIVPLRFVSAAEMAEILAPLAGDGSVIRVDAPRNLLLLAGTSRELSLWTETIQTFDIDWFSGKSVGVFPLTQVSADKVVTELEAIFKTADDDDGAISFIAIDRTNAVLAVSRAAPLLEKVRVWTKRLDQDAGASRRLRVYPMKNARATDVAPLLQEIFDAPGGGQSDAASIVAPGATPVTRSSEGVVAVSTAGSAMSAGSARAGGQRNSGPRTNGQAAGTAGLRIIPDEAANTLLMMSTQDEFQRIVNALRQLDVAPLQVLVEATIVEVTLTDELRYGVQYFLEGDIAKESSVGVLTNLATQAIAPTAPGASLVIGEPSKIVLDALEGVTEVNVISSPNLMVLDNQTARLVVGDKIPVTVQNVTNGFTSAENDPVLFNSIEFRDTGVIFEVTPKISSDGSVTLGVVQEVSTVAPTSSPTLTPTISQRRIESSIVATSGETIVLGGLFSDNVTRGRSGLPIVSRAPFFGGLFSSTNRNETRTELVVLIQPRILQNETQARAITQELKDRVTGLRLLSPENKLRQRAPAPITRDFEGSAPAEFDAEFLPVDAEIVDDDADLPSEAVVAAAAPSTETDLPVLEQPPLNDVLAASDDGDELPPLEPAELSSVIPTSAVQSALDTDEYFVQLGAFDSVTGAQRASEKAVQNDQQLLSANFTARESDGVWRLLVGPLDPSGAQALCNELATPCAVVTE
ncbi:MAG: type II secretion system secretin GspD [Pseudomonadota bacterium]